MRIIYLADDGTKFDDKYECLDYEWKQEHPHLKDVVFFDENNEEIEDKYSFDTYITTEKIVVKTQEEADDVIALGEYTGYCAYRDIIEPGVWVFSEKEETFAKIINK